jgi:hypothetical protein
VDLRIGFHFPCLDPGFRRVAVLRECAPIVKARRTGADNDNVKCVFGHQQVPRSPRLAFNHLSHPRQAMVAAEAYLRQDNSAKSAGALQLA